MRCMLRCCLFVVSSLSSAKIESCILGKGTQLGPKAELTRCVTQAGVEVGAGGKQPDHHGVHAFTESRPSENVKGEKLEVSNWMASPEEMDELTD